MIDIFYICHFYFTVLVLFNKYLYVDMYLYRYIVCWIPDVKYIYCMLLLKNLNIYERVFYFFIIQYIYMYNIMYMVDSYLICNVDRDS